MGPEIKRFAHVSRSWADRGRDARAVTVYAARQGMAMPSLMGIKSSNRPGG